MSRRFSMNPPITIQDIDDATAKWIIEEAERRGINVESLIVELIHKGIDVDAKARRSSPITIWIH